MKLSDEAKAKLAEMMVRVADANETELSPPITVFVSNAVITLKCERSKRSFMLFEIDEAEEFLNALISEARRVGEARKIIRNGVNNLMQALDQSVLDFKHLSEYERVLDEVTSNFCSYVAPVKVEGDDEEDDF